MLSSQIPRREMTMTDFMSSMGLMGTISLSNAILNRIFSEGPISTKFLKRWPGRSGSEGSKRSLESPMATDTRALNFEDRASSAEDSYFSVRALEEAATKRSPFHRRLFREFWVN